MPKIEFAYPTPYNEGTPKINCPSIYGASPNKPFLYKIPTTGERPFSFSVDPSLPDGLKLDGNSRVISGAAKVAGKHIIKIQVSNSLGSDEKEICIHIAEDNSLRTPLLGWTSWNAYRWKVSQENVLQTAELMVSTGLSSYGYQYVNIDSAWQGEYGGKFNAIMPNEKFPDMAKLYERIHELGLKGGIYSTPMMKAWGLPDSADGLPGCTIGEPDSKYPEAHFPIGLERREENNVKQWCEWGVDYLKYDWSPTDKENADFMKQQLFKADRDIAFCVTVHADPKEVEYWKQNCSSYRHQTDSSDNWQTVKAICFGADKWARHVVQGHYFDLDMLEVGPQFNIEQETHRDCNLNEDEQLVAFSARALFPSPIQLSSDLSKLSAFDIAMFCNEEIIAVNQDASGHGAVCVTETIKHNDVYELAEHTKVYKRMLEDGSLAVGFFNIGEMVATLKFPLSKAANVRDLWAKRTLGMYENELVLELEPHTVRMLKVCEI